MPRPAQRSRSFRKKKVNTPGGKAVIHYVKKKPSPATCASCGGQLHGVPRELPSGMKKLPKTKKRPDRPYGGTLCPKCARHAVKVKNMERWKE
jgi:large subunit ribosomal protein L34e